MKYNGGVPKTDLSEPNLEALKKGICNLEKHIENIQKYNVPLVVTLNRFVTDFDEELKYVEEFVRGKGCDFALSEVWEKGGEGGLDLADAVIYTLDTKTSSFKPVYNENKPIKEKIETIAKEIYGAGAVTYSAQADSEIKRMESLGLDKIPVCMAKTQYSLSDNEKILGRPDGFTLNVRELYPSAGAGFLVAVTGSIMTMPGLPRKPAAEGIDVIDGKITGLF